jgi:hypothetical protein
MTDAMKEPPSPEMQLARYLARFWPHREHESGLLRSLLCSIGIHLWLQPNYTGLAGNRRIRFCHWCPTIEIDGVGYRP